MNQINEIKIKSNDGNQYGVFAFAKMIKKVSRKEAIKQLEANANGQNYEQVFCDGKNFYM